MTIFRDKSTQQVKRKNRCNNIKIIRHRKSSNSQKNTKTVTEKHIF